MTTVTRVMFTCDICGKAKDVRTFAFGVDGKRYEIDLCQEDSNGLSEVVAGYAPEARKIADRQGRRRNDHGPRPPRAASDGRGTAGTKRSAPGRSAGATRAKAKSSRPDRQAAKVSDATARAAASKRKAPSSRPQPRKASADSGQAARAGGRQQGKGVYVYGILPADIEIAAETPGVGEHPGPLAIVRCDGLAALISEVSLPGRLGSSEDLRTHREILDSTAIEVPVLPLRFGTVLTGEAAVADELLAPNHDEFAAALEQLEGRAEFVVRSRYVQEAVPGEMAAARREEDARALQQAMEAVCVASVVQEPAHELEGVHVAFLVAVDQESEVERVVEDMARKWEERAEVHLLGPMAAYDFTAADLH